MKMLLLTVNLQVRVWLPQKAQFWQAKSVKTDLLHKFKVFQIQINEESHGFTEICKLSQKKIREFTKKKEDTT